MEARTAHLVRGYFRGDDPPACACRCRRSQKWHLLSTAGTGLLMVLLHGGEAIDEAPVDPLFSR